MEDGTDRGDSEVPGPVVPEESKNSIVRELCFTIEVSRRE